MRSHSSRNCWVCVCTALLTLGIFGILADKGKTLEETETSTASLSYRDIYRISCPLDSPRLMHDQVTFYVGTSSGGIEFENISASIQENGNTTRIAIDEFGRFRLPASEDLLAKDPKVVFNQPKGTLALWCCVDGLRITVPKNLTLSYRELVGPVLTVMTMDRIIEPRSGSCVPSELWFDLGIEVTGSVTIKAARTSKEMMIQTQAGVLRLPLSGDLLQVNPIVVFPEKSKCARVLEPCGFEMSFTIGCIPEF